MEQTVRFADADRSPVTMELHGYRFSRFVAVRPVNPHNKVTHRSRLAAVLPLCYLLPRISAQTREMMQYREDGP